MAIVTANCAKSLPVIPGMKTLRQEDGRKHEGDGDDRPGDLLHRLARRLFGGQALGDVVFHRLHDDDGVVHDEADGQHHAHEGDGVDGEAEEGEQGKRGDEGYRHGESRDEGRPPPLEEDEDDDDDQDHRLVKRMQDLLDPFADGQRRVEGDRVFQVGREGTLGFFQQFFTPSTAAIAFVPGS